MVNYIKFSDIFNAFIYGDDEIDGLGETEGLFDMLFYPVFSALVRLNALYGVSLVKNGIVSYDGNDNFQFVEQPYKPFSNLASFMYNDVRKQLFDGVAKANGWEFCFETEDIESAINVSSLLLFLDGAVHNQYVSKNVVDTALKELVELGIDFDELADKAALKLASIWDVELPGEVIRKVLDDDLSILNKVTIYKMDEPCSSRLINESYLEDSNIFDNAFDLAFTRVMLCEGTLYLILKSYDYGDLSGSASIGVEHFGNTEVLFEF